MKPIKQIKKVKIFSGWINELENYYEAFVNDETNNRFIRGADFDMMDNQLYGKLIIRYEENMPENYKPPLFRVDQDNHHYPHAGGKYELVRWTDPQGRVNSKEALIAQQEEKRMAAIREREANKPFPFEREDPYKKVFGVDNGTIELRKNSDE
jgi:hypothetical protein